MTAVQAESVVATLLQAAAVLHAVEEMIDQNDDPCCTPHTVKATAAGGSIYISLYFTFLGAQQLTLVCCLIITTLALIFPSIMN